MGGGAGSIIHELLKGEPSVFGPLDHNQSTRGTKMQGWGMVWETSYFLYNTHRHTHTHRAALEDTTGKYSVAT